MHARKGFFTSDPDEPSEDESIARLRSGDAAAYETIFKVYAARLCDFAFRYVRSREEAEDVVQGVLAKVWEQHSTIVIRGTLPQFLYLSVRNAARDRLKHEKVRQRWREHSVAVGQDASQDTPDADLDRADRHAAIDRALAELPERRRIVCSLRWQDGLTYAEIAQRLGISEQTVKNQLTRAVEGVRARLRELLG